MIENIKSKIKKITEITSPDIKSKIKKITEITPSDMSISDFNILKRLERVEEWVERLERVEEWMENVADPNIKSTIQNIQVIYDRLVKASDQLSRDTQKMSSNLNNAVNNIKWLKTDLAEIKEALALSRLSPLSNAFFKPPIISSCAMLENSSIFCV